MTGLRGSEKRNYRLIRSLARLGSERVARHRRRKLIVCPYFLELRDMSQCDSGRSQNGWNPASLGGLGLQRCNLLIMTPVRGNPAVSLSGGLPVGLGLEHTAHLATVSAI